MKEHPNDLPNPAEMVQRLTTDYELIIRNLREHVAKCSEEYKDEGTADFLTALMEEYEKTAWMLRSFLTGGSVTDSAGSQSIDHTPASV